MAHKLSGETGEPVVLAEGDRDVVLTAAQHAIIRRSMDDVSEQLRAVYAALEAAEAAHQNITNTLWRAANINQETV